MNETSTENVLILIVEDSPTQSLKLQHVLERHDYGVITTTNGREAFDALDRKSVV